MLGTLLASFASLETAQAATRLKRAAISYVLAGLSAFAGAGFLLIAAFIYIARRYGPLETAVGFAVAFFAIALIVFTVHRIASAARVRRAARRRSTELKTIAIPAALTVLPLLMRTRAGAGAILLPAAALAALAILRENIGDRAPDRDD